MTQTNKNNFKQTIRICYPAGTGTLVIRTDLDWARDTNPVAVSSDGNTATFENNREWRCYMRDPDGYLIEVGQYTQMALDHFKKYAL